MRHSDEIRALRAHLQRLEEELIQARARLSTLELKVQAEETPPALVTPTPIEPIVDIPAPAPEPAAAPAKPAATPPPLPWDREATITPQPAAAKVAAPATVVASPPAPKAPPKPRRRFGPPEDMDLETAIGRWWVPRIGIVMLSVGVVFLLMFTANKLMSGWLRPYLQVAGGYAVAVGLLVAAKRMEATARNYARVLASGGFALTYFVTFAAHFVVKPPVVASELLTGLLLFAVVLGWTAVAQRRQSRLLGLGVTVLGHLTIFLSLKSADTVPLFSTAALLLFGLGSAFFLVKNRWYEVGAAGMVCSYLNLAALLDGQVFYFHTMTTFSAVGLLAVVYAIFALAELFAPEDLRRRDVRLSLRSAYVATNTFLALAISWLLWNRAGGSDLPGIHVLYGAAAVLVLIIARLYLHARRGDPLYNIYQIKGLSLLTLAFAKYLSGEQLAVTLAVESLLLLLNASVTGFVVSRVFSWLSAALAGLVLTYQLLFDRLPTLDLHSFAFYAFWITFALLHVVGAVYLRVNWRTRGLHAGDVPAWARDGLRALDLLDTPPGVGIFCPRLGDGLPHAIWPLTYSVFASAPWLLYAVQSGGAGGVFLVATGLAFLALTLAGAALRAWNLTFSLLTLAVALTSVVTLRFWAEFGRTREAASSISEIIALFPYGWFTLALSLAVASETARISRLRAPELWPRLLGRPRGSAHAFAACMAPALLAFFWSFPAEQGVTLALAGFGFAVYTVATNAAFWQTTMLLQMLACVMAYGRVDMDHATYVMHAYASSAHQTVAAVGHANVLYYALTALLTGATVAWSQWRPFTARSGWTRFHQLPGALWLAGWWFFLLFFWAWEPYATISAYSLPGVVLLAIALCFLADARVFALCALCTLAAASAVLAFWPKPNANLLAHADAFNAFEHRLSTALGAGPQWLLGILLLVACGIALEHTARRKNAWLQFRLDDIAVLIAAALVQRAVAVEVTGPVSFTTAFIALLLTIAYVAWRGHVITGIAGLAFATLCTLVAAEGTYGDFDLYPILGPILSTGAATAFWFLCERGLAFARTRGKVGGPRWQDALAVVANALPIIVAALLLRTLHQIDALANFYLTIAWTLAAVALMTTGALTQQPYYRYAALGTFGIVTLRAAIWDTRNLELLPRAISWMLLGVVLLAVAYGYIRARGKTQPPTPNTPPPSPPPPPLD